MKSQHIVAAIDIGTSHIIAALAEISADGDIVPIALAEVLSKGVKKGGVVNIPLVQHTIDSALEKLQADGSYHIYSIVTSLSGVSIMGYNADGMVELKGTPISEHNIRQVVAEARNLSTLEGRQILHILRQSFSVDKQTDIDNPIGLMGEQLAIRVHVISAAKMAYYNLLQTFSHRDIDVEQVVAAGFSSALAVSSADEKQLGICVLDIGAGTTDVTVIHQGVVKHTEVIPLGGEVISNDVAFFMRTTTETAERIKKEIDVDAHYLAGQHIDVQGLSGTTRRFAKTDISEVIQERYQQLLEIIWQKLTRAGVEALFPGGFVICGGVAEQKGLDALLMQQSQLPVRRAMIEVPLKSGTQKSSRYAAIMGLFMCAYEEDFARIMKDEQKTGIISRLVNTFAKLRKNF
ncbi:MAG: cell division protein FtsA [Gammaproteobacteria bacterium]|nr:MAG: cell division protein FtsA [Gammaproteobacteria bacterium]